MLPSPLCCRLHPSPPRSAPGRSSSSRSSPGSSQLILTSRAAELTPATCCHFETPLQDALRELGRIIVRWTYNHLEPDDRCLMPTHHRCDGAWYRRRVAVLTRLPGPPLRLAFVTDAGHHATAYYERVLKPMGHPSRQGEHLEWEWVIDYDHMTQYIHDLSAALFRDARRAQAWARKMCRRLKTKPRAPSCACPERGPASRGTICRGRRQVEWGRREGPRGVPGRSQRGRASRVVPEGNTSSRA